MTETGVSVPCRSCGCLIIFSDNNISQTGIPIPMNFSDNKFGARGVNHNCRPKYAAPDPSKTDMHVFCPSCLTEHDRRIHPWCPCCFKLLCHECGLQWVATTFNIMEVLDDGEVLRECPNCGSMNYEQVEDIESWHIAWKRREGMVAALKCEKCGGTNWINPPPLNYRRSTTKVAVSLVPDLPYRDYWKCQAE